MDDRHLPDTGDGPGLSVGPQVAVAGLPDGLVAYRVETLTRRTDGSLAPKASARSSAVQFSEVWGVAAAPHPDDPELPHPEVRKLLGTETKVVKAKHIDASFALARAGLVALRLPVRVADGQLVCGQPTRWHRTEHGAIAASVYESVPGSASAAARGVADELLANNPTWVPGWAMTQIRVAANFEEMMQRARGMVRDQTMAGEPVSRIALELTGRTHGLDRGQPALGLVIEAVSDEARCPPDRDEVFIALGAAHMRYSSSVTSRNLPGDTQTVAGRLLEAHSAEGCAAVLHLANLPADTSNPVVAPPPDGSPGWVFAVENEAVLAAVAGDPTYAAPVVWHGSVAARRLLQHAAAAGWKVAITGDFEWGGLRRVVHLLAKVQGAVPWMLTADDYTCVAGVGTSDPISPGFVNVYWDSRLVDEMNRYLERITEEDQFSSLLRDIKRGWPLEHRGL